MWLLRLLPYLEQMLALSYEIESKFTVCMEMATKRRAVPSSPCASAGRHLGDVLSASFSR